MSYQFYAGDVEILHNGICEEYIFVPCKLCGETGQECAFAACDQGAPGMLLYEGSERADPKRIPAVIIGVQMLDPCRVVIARARPQMDRRQGVGILENVRDIQLFGRDLGKNAPCELLPFRSRP